MADMTKKLVPAILPNNASIIMKRGVLSCYAIAAFIMFLIELKWAHLASTVAFIIGLIAGSATIEYQGPFREILDLVIFTSDEVGDAQSLVLLLVTVHLMAAYLLGFESINITDIILTLSLLLNLSTLFRMYNLNTAVTKSLVQMPRVQTITEEMKKDACEILSKAVVQPMASEPKAPFDPKVDVGEQPVNLKQTRKVVLDAITSVTSDRTIPAQELSHDSDRRSMLGEHSSRLADQDCDSDTIKSVLDLLIILDTTESMGDYIESSKQSIAEICSVLMASGKLRRSDGLRVGLIAYRDYPEADNEYVLNPHPFTDDLKTVVGYLAPLKPYGGGDRPEAFSTALDYAYNEMEGWRDDALKAIVVITDAAPHGIGESKDDYPNGMPQGVRMKDPLQVAKDLAEARYSIFALACEPKLGQTTKFAIDFYKALSDRTLGRFCSLTDHRLLPAYIIGTLLEKIDLRLLSRQYEEHILKDILENHLTVDQVVLKLHDELTSKQQEVTNMQIGEIYKDVPDANENYRAFVECTSLADAKPLLRNVDTSRIADKDLKTLQKYKRELENGNDLYNVSVYFRNQGNGKIVLQIFDAEACTMQSEEVVPDGQVIVKHFKINIPVNFTATFGRVTKNFSKVFVNNTTIDVDGYFS